MKTEILKCLKESKDYLSGEMISQKFGVSRTAIWKYMNQLRQEGYEIESVPRKGYRLLEIADRITASEILSLNQAKWVGRQVKSYESIDSTNQEARRLAAKEGKNGLLVVSEEQTGGRGRRGRAWTSPKETGIWMSLLLRPDLEPQDASMITLIAALATAKAIKQVSDLDVLIKWPNDLVYNNKKVCGILTEMSAEIDEILYVIVGIGINVNTKEFPEEIKERATSLAMEKGQKIHRAKLIAAFCLAFETYYEQFLQTKDLAFMKEEYETHLVNVGRQVRIIKRDGERIRTAIGINERGELLVKDDLGRIEEVFSGEVSVRGLYGYTQ